MAINLFGNPSIDRTVSRMLGSVGAHLIWFGLHLREAASAEVPSLAPYLPLQLQGVLFQDMPSLKTFASSHIPLVTNCGPLATLQRFVYLRNLSCALPLHVIADLSADDFKRFIGSFSGGDGAGDRVVVLGSRWSELVRMPFPVNNAEIERDVGLVGKVPKPSAADFASVYFSRAGGVVQDITGRTLGVYRERDNDREIMVDYEQFFIV